MWKEKVVSKFWILSRNLMGRHDAKLRKTSGQLVSRPRFESGTFHLIPKIIKIKKKKFLEELIICFLIRQGLHRKQCLQQSSKHVLCDCEATARLKFRHLGQFFLEPSDYYNAPINKVLHFIQSAELIRGWSQGKHNRSLMVAVQGPDCSPPLLHSFIHSIMWGIYEVHCWDGLRYHDIHTKFHKCWYSHSKVNSHRYTDIEMQKYRNTQQHGDRRSLL
jgi:hypothetical protein